MSININLDTSLSLQDMAEAQQQGFSVMRSAHVGNARGYNLAVASMGIPVLLVDHNVVSQYPDKAGDKNYLPGSIVTRRAITPLKTSSIGGLSLRTEVVSPFSGEVEFVDQLHANSLRQAFPETDIFTNTDYVRSEETITGEIANIAMTSQPELFTRRVENDGTVTRSGLSLASSATKYGILQLNDDPRTNPGLLIPNEVDIVTNFVIEAIRSGKDTQIHLSGPDMQLYTKDKSLRATFNQLYQSVLDEASFGRQLPETLNVKLVPANQARFVSSGDRIRALTTVFDWLRYESKEIIEPKANFFKNNPNVEHEDKAEFMHSFREKIRQLSLGLSQAVAEIPEIFTEPRDAPFISQYDVLRKIPPAQPWIAETPAGLVMPAENTNLSMDKLKVLYSRLKNIRDQGP